MRDAGLTNAQALQTATINAARFFRLQKRYGSIGKGKAADLVLLDANPLVDVRNTTKNAISLKFPFIQLGPSNRMGSERYAKVLNAMRARYAVHYTKLLGLPPVPVVATPDAPDSPGAGSVSVPESGPTPSKPGPGGAPKTKRAKWPM